MFKASLRWNQSLFFFAAICIALNSLSCNQESSQCITTIFPYQFTINIPREEMEKSLEKRGILLHYEDSHKDVYRGVRLDYFGEEYNGIEYSVKIYSMEDKVKGIEAILISDSLPKDIFFKRVDTTVLNHFQFCKNDLLLDTSRKVEIFDNKYDLIQYRIFVRTKNLNAVLDND